MFLLKPTRPSVPCHCFCAKVGGGGSCNYLLRYYYPCHLHIFTLFIQPGREPPKTHTGLGWSGGSGYTGLVHGVCGVCVFMDTPFPYHSLTHLVVSPPTRDKIATTDLKLGPDCLFVRRSEVKVTLLSHLQQEFDK